ncbi:hypothetical protein [Burkholderia latens]|uniref:hypothetical protein n=1 Tax=Burkholderia latens TaxID=488446 RepID=UPI001AE9D5E4|nr:hypothetical protein [Burkholderia latens]QTO42171.1 hypothetical protein J8I85_08675 [Burkholderia latens]
MNLPVPFTPAAADLRDAPVPLDMLVELAIAQFGMTATEAEAAARQCAAAAGIPLGEVAHG